ncbi:Uncharacterised protein [Moraxella lacunata]|uniref:Uncharacterized protein n=1 Tax=Moraxella lacunata TaxID=477 RepID=A0A378TSS7_MORLA|nr:hypothetical protein [Moraxella lacunata]STZ63915.1 Uncharacterised protein [Moraxella lacunata]
MNEIDQATQQAINAKILSSLDSIHNQNRQIAQKIDDLEQSVTKKATVAGAIAGAVAGTATSGMFSIGMEIVKAKFGG